MTNTTQLDAEAEHRRLAILKCLKEDQDYQINLPLLQSLLKSMGHGVSTSLLKSDVAWLEQQRLVASNQLGSVTVVTLRNDGLDVACGVAYVPGVARPMPE